MHKAFFSMVSFYENNQAYLTMELFCFNHNYNTISVQLVYSWGAVDFHGEWWLLRDLLTLKAPQERNDVEIEAKSAESANSEW